MWIVPTAGYGYAEAKSDCLEHSPFNYLRLRSGEKKKVGKTVGPFTMWKTTN